MSIFSSKLTYGDFQRTGEQDCGNVLQYDDFDLKAGTPHQIVEKAWAEWEDDGMEEQWLEQQDDFEGLDPHKCYEAWKDGWKSCARRAITAKLEDAEVYGDEPNDNPPPKWWRKPAPTKDRTCYRTKIEALRKFLEVNYRIVENYGGADYKVSPSEFDSINHKYDLAGKNACRTIAEAVWAAMPVGKPYCLDRIDLDALNDTSPAREAGVAFVLPDVVYATQMAEEEARHYAPAEESEPAWVTEHETPRSPALPAMPIRLQLEEREPGVETYKMFDNPRVPKAARFAVGSKVSYDDHDFTVVKTDYRSAKPAVQLRPISGGPDRWAPASHVFPAPVRLQLEDKEPGVETYSINPGRSEWGFDVTLFKPGGWMKILCALGIDAEPERRLMYHDEPDVVFIWKGPGIEIATAGNPVTGEWGNHRREREKEFAGYIGIRGRAAKVAQAKKLVRKYASYLEDKRGSKGLDFIDFYERKRGGGRIAIGHNPAMKSNPAWVTNILSKHYVKLEEQIPAKWLPKLTSTSTQRGKLVAAMKEYGCGAYGCVLPTLDPQVVLKLTTDDTEAQFAYDLADKLAAPVVVKYHLTFALPDVYKGRQVYLLWRDSAEHVDKVEQTIAEEGGTDPVLVEAAIATQHAAAQEAFEALDAGQPAEKLLKKWETAAREMGESVPELRELAEGMITNLHENKVFFGDVHGGNIGLVNGKWLVVDPGHVAVLEA